MFRDKREEFGNWKYVKSLGSGGNGEVHLWQNRVSRERIAVKSLKFPPDRDDVKEKQRWHDEIAFAKKILHENIVHAISPQPDLFASYLIKLYPPEPLVMEFCEKGDLRKRLSRPENMNGMPETEVRNILKCLRNAIVYLHSKGITHRDIKPENLVIKEVKGVDVYKLTDLGYARAIICTIEASHVGTFEYFAPEVITEPSYSNTVDYWSMGVIAFEIVCGIRPFLPGCAVMQVMKLIQAKSCETIAISKSAETNEVCNHTTLFNQNHVSSCFKQHMERWLRIALSINPRARGITADISPGAHVSRLNDKTTDQSPTNLKIFKDLDNLLSLNILTVFCMHNFRMFSYAISETTSREGFLKTLSLDTGITVDDLVIIVPPENARINRFASDNRPVELYIEDFYEKPMIYCATDKDTLKETSQNAGMSPVLVRALEENAVKSRKHAEEVVRHMMFYVQMQGRFATMFLQGLFNYAVMVDDWILKYQIKVDEMSSMFWQLQGAMQCYLLQTEHANKMISEKNVPHLLENHSEKIIERFKQIGELFCRTRNRFVSVLRRSKGIISDLTGNFNTFLKTVEDMSSIAPLNEFYDQYRDGNNETATIIATSMFKYFNNFQEKNWFVHSSQIKNIESTISEIHVEFELIMSVVEKLISQQVEMSQTINKIACELNESIWNIATKSASGSKNDVNDGPNIPDLDSILVGLKIATIANGSMDGNYSICNGMSSSSGKDWSLMTLSDEGQTIVDENERLCDRVQKMLKSRVLDQ